MSAIVKRDESELAESVSGELPAIFQLAKELTQARGFIPSHLKTTGEIAAVILAGRELGLPPMTSLRSVYLVNGKVGLDASMQLALMKRAGIRHEWLADGSDCKVARLKLERPGEAPYEQVYSIDDAKRAGLANSGTWQKHTPAMLRARCVSSAARAYAPDVLSGVYSPDEIEEMRGAYAAPQQPSPRLVSTQTPAAEPVRVDVVTGEIEPVTEPEVAQPAQQPADGALSPADEIRMLVEGDLNNCGTREALIAWAGALIDVRANAKAKEAAWKAFQAKAMLCQLEPRELVDAAKAGRS
jgi:hypothetical protein